MSGQFERILPFLEPIAPLLLDTTITEIMVNNGGRKVFFERDGFIEETDITLDTELLEDAIVKVARACNDDISEEQPILDGRLEDGSRVSAMFPPCAVDGATLNIRKFGERYTVRQLVERGSVTEAVAKKLVEDVRTHRNILISGGTGTGKTTLLNALADTIPDRDRIVLIEENSEVLIHKPNLVRMESRGPQVKLGTEEPMQEISIAMLVKAALRARPDRIILGEVRQGEAWDLLQALNTGHLGSLSTIHANSALQALLRLSHCVLMASIDLPLRSAREAISLAIHTVVHIDRVEGQRRVAQVISVDGYNERKDQFLTTSLYSPPSATNGDRRALEAV